MLVECVNEANQTLYKDDACGSDNWSHYPRPLAPPLAPPPQYPRDAPGSASAATVRGRYIKKWLHSLYHQPHYAPGTAPNAPHMPPGSQGAWNPALWMFHQQQQHFAHVKQENNPDGKECM